MRKLFSHCFDLELYDCALLAISANMFRIVSNIVQQQQQACIIGDLIAVVWFVG